MLLFWTTAKIALRSLLANKLRSFLSMLGIIIGVSAVIAMLAFGTGAQQQVLDRVTALGANLLMVVPGQHMRGGVRGGAVETLTLEDAQALLVEVPEVKKVSPLVNGSGQFKYYANNMQANIIGATVTYFDIRDRGITTGRAFTVNEVDQRARVTVLGSAVVEELFAEENAVGEEVKINGISFEVIGVMEEKGSVEPFNEDEVALMPYTTAMKRILGVDYLNEVDMQIDAEADQVAVEEKVNVVMRTRHEIRDPDDDDFHVRNMAEMVATASSVTQTFTLLLGAVAAISLVVGGIGIMNIMLVTVTERTREIGIRKAIGERERDVLIQFLLEAVLMSALGGIVGVGIGIGAASAVTAVTGFPTVVEPASVILALAFSAAVGVFFGFYPARRAASLDPIDALSYE